LETGVTIMGEPARKKTAPFHLLSGGEKALDAIGLRCLQYLQSFYRERKTPESGLIRKNIHNEISRTTEIETYQKTIKKNKAK